MSKMLAIMFALSLAFAYSCGGSGGSGSGGAAGYTPDNAPASTAPTSLSTAEKTAVESYVTSYVTALAGAFSGMTSKAAEKVSQCISGPIDECGSAQVCYEVNGSQSGGHYKMWMDEAIDCNGVSIYFWELDVDYSASGTSYTISNSAGAIDIEYDEGFGTNPLRIFVKWDKDGSVDGWIAENGVKTGEIGGTTDNPTVTWE